MQQRIEEIAFRIEGAARGRVSARHPSSSKCKRPFSSRERAFSRSPRRDRRSASPVRRSDRRAARRKPSPNHTKPFRDASNASELRSVCAICLGRHPHEVTKCAAATFWSGQGKTRCRRNSRKRIINPDGLELCTDWQREVGCTQKGQRHNHECSGCGESAHGASECSLAQKA